MLRVQRQASAGVPGCWPLPHFELRAAASVGFGAGARPARMMPTYYDRIAHKQFITLMWTTMRLHKRVPSAYARHCC